MLTFSSSNLAKDSSALVTRRRWPIEARMEKWRLLDRYRLARLALGRQFLRWRYDQIILWCFLYMVSFHWAYDSLLRIHWRCICAVNVIGFCDICCRVQFIWQVSHSRWFNTRYCWQNKPLLWCYYHFMAIGNMMGCAGSLRDLGYFLFYRSRNDSS